MLPNSSPGTNLMDNASVILGSFRDIFVIFWLLDRIISQSYYNLRRVENKRPETGKELCKHEITDKLIWNIYKLSGRSVYVENWLFSEDVGMIREPGTV